MAEVINIVTAVSRPHNLPRIKRSIEMALLLSSLDVRWILVIDDEVTPSAAVEDELKGAPFEIQRVAYRGGRCAYGISQKNIGMGLIKNGYYHCLDDDNIVHREFFHGLEKAMKTARSKRAFVFGQERWDNIRTLKASPDRMEYGKIDNTMFAVHSELIGARRYDLSQSGREDFEFFRKLYDLHKEEFVFIPETLAYYNYIYHFPNATKAELTPPVIQVSRAEYKAALPPPSDATGRTQGVLKIALYSSKRERCGISTYTAKLEEAFATLGHDVRYFGSQPPHSEAFEEILAWKPDVFHAQHETSIMPPESVLEKYAGLMAKDGVRVMVTLHTVDERTLQVAGAMTMDVPGRVITHRPAPGIPAGSIIPMPCTTLGVVPDKAGMRRKYGFPEDAFVVSTVGFMIPWKEHDKIAGALVPWLKENPRVHLQIIASAHFNESMKGYADICRKALASVSSRFTQNRIHHIDGYPSDQELVERLVASDLGYVWCPFDTGSSSAAAAQFTAARCPLVATDSTHYAHLGDGIVRSSKVSMEAFVGLIEMVADDPELLETLKQAQWRLYQERNYIAVAQKHLALYGLYKGGAS
jgi:glycosyltransferase involved in cell wall biosynthesis